MRRETGTISIQILFAQLHTMFVLLTYTFLFLFLRADIRLALTRERIINTNGKNSFFFLRMRRKKAAPVRE